ncbi:MinD/ParA family protein [Aminobacterium mobile]|uniref:MinD/ParA family protein n=1 Tax=Aminobacterium mobile TaxID=81467 RepID=UPI00046699E0|nr:MinD/ParA family protein [Aminobacterium mobile]
MHEEERKSTLDQAGELRLLVEKKKDKENVFLKPTRSLAIVSGKGGVGKSSFSVNISLALSDLGASVILMDADMGMANIDLLLGLAPRYSLAHVVRGSRDFDEVMIDVDARVAIIPGGSGMQEMADADEDTFLRLFEKLTSLEKKADFLIIDTGAGIHKDVLTFALASDSVMVVTTPEPPSIRDAYGLMKVLALESKSKADVHLVVNMAHGKREADETAERIRKVAHRFLSLDVTYDGFIPADDKVRQAIRLQRPVLREYPYSLASASFRSLALGFMGNKEQKILPPSRGLKTFFLRLVRGVQRMEL